VNSGERVDEGINLIRQGKWNEVAEYIRTLRGDDPLAAELVEVCLCVYRYASPDALRKGRRLLSAVSDKPELATRLFNWLGTAHRMMGELEAAEHYFLRALEIAESLGEPRLLSATRLNLLLVKFFSADYQVLRRELPGFIRSATPPNAYWGKCIQVILDIMSGNLASARRNLDALLQDSRKVHRYTAREAEAFLLRLEGKTDLSVKLYLELTENFLGFSSPYAAITCAKAMEITRLKGLEPLPSGIIRKCVRLAEKGSWGEQAAGREIEALLRPSDAEAAAGVLESAEGYRKASLPLEAFTAGLSAAYLAWVSDAPVFPKALKFLSPLASLYPGMKNDPILGGFMRRAEPLMQVRSPTENERRIRAWLIEGPRIFVGEREIRVEDWYNKKAARAFIYLLLSPRHRIHIDHLFYLLWPRRKFAGKNRELLYVAVYNIRKAIGDPSLLTKRRDYYQLEDVWSDLDEIDNLIRLADIATDRDEKAAMLERAKELSEGDLLPGMLDDRYVEEYRAHFARLKRRLSDLIAQ